MMNLNTPFKPPKMRRPVSSGSSFTPNPSSSLPLKRSSPNSPSGSETSRPKINPTGETKVYAVLYRKKTMKKHKTWDGDGKLHLNTVTNKAIIKNDDGEMIGIVSHASAVIYNGDIFKCGSFECELDGEVENTQMVTIPSAIPAKRSIGLNSRTQFLSPLLDKLENIPSTYSSKSSRTLKPLLRPSSATEYEPTPPVPIVVNKPFQAPSFKSSTIIGRPLKKKAASEPLYDISLPNALVLPRPPESKTDEEIKDVVVDPILTAKLRPHQKEGVQFLYECVMGYKNYKGYGAILADDMGLGKTLQTVTLVWTLARQNCIVGRPPIASKVLICCPVTLIKNWQREFKKWLDEKVRVLVIGNNKYSNEEQDIQGFASTRVHQVMIIGYEKMQKKSALLKEVGFDLVVCDEGHRLKNSSNKVMQALESLHIKRRIVLSGTPIQNDLNEFYTIINFINPGVLGGFKDFQKEFMKPILKARDPSCTNQTTNKYGKKKSDELIKLTKLFILRRTNEELEKYLPKRSDYILFAPPSNLQLKLFRAITDTKKFDIIAETNDKKESLPLIQTFRKACNSPSLLKDDNYFLNITGKKGDIEFRNFISKKLKSGKINLLIHLLSNIAKFTDEKVVIISNFTQTLDVIQRLLETLQVTYLRLDGSTDGKDRDKLVNTFNKTSNDDVFAFLLSSKAGGCGLNLIGASRLILFDNDWNPSTDLQAMARIHRDGQKKDCFVYRLMTSGCIDEKILQRQLVKTNLSNKFLDNATDSNDDYFDYSDLKDLFTIGEDVKCNTHDLMNCDCEGKGEPLVFDDLDGDDEEECLEATKVPSFTSALDYSQNFNDINEASEKRQKQIKRCLTGYRHLDPYGEHEIKSDDKILNELIAEQKFNADSSGKNSFLNFAFGKY